jgi:hypothetical protein
VPTLPLAIGEGVVLYKAGQPYSDTYTVVAHKPVPFAFVTESWKVVLVFIAEVVQLPP